MTAHVQSHSVLPKVLFYRTMYAIMTLFRSGAECLFAMWQAGCVPFHERGEVNGATTSEVRGIS